MLGNILILLLRNKDFDKSVTVMNTLDRNHTTIVGIPKLEALARFIDACIEEKKPSHAIVCTSLIYVLHVEVLNAFFSIFRNVFSIVATVDSPKLTRWRQD